jgi:hypothetical protein
LKHFAKDLETNLKSEKKWKKKKGKEEIKIEKGPRGTHLARHQNRPTAQQ